MLETLYLGISDTSKDIFSKIQHEKKQEKITTRLFWNIFSNILKKQTNKKPQNFPLFTQFPDSCH